MLLYKQLKCLVVKFRLNTFFPSLRVCLQVHSMVDFLLASSFLFLILTLLLSVGFYNITCVFFLILFYFLTLQNCISFAKYQNESTTGIHVFPILNPSSLLPPHTVPLGRPSAPAPSIQYRASNLDW